MNADLFQFQKNFSMHPEERECSLDSNGAAATCCKFNRLGTLLAAGSTDGRLFIFDFLTKSIVKSWNAHVKPIISLSWSRSGKRLLSSGADGSIGIWDVLNIAEPIKRFNCGSIGTTTQTALFNPRNESQILIYLIQHNSGICSPPIVRNFDTNLESRLSSIGRDSVDELVSAATFSRKGEYIITGSIKGQIIVYDAQTLKPISHCRQQGNQQQIKNFAISMSPKTDYIIRCYRMAEMLSAKPGSTLQPLQKFQDVVNKTLWKCIATSGDGDYICGGSSKSHTINIWERSTGTLVKILHGPKGELLSDVQWHPNKPVVVSVAAGTGTITVWTQARVENWSAFAPDFTELEENHKYVEKEGEFDTLDEDASDTEKEKSKCRREEDAAELVDVCTLSPPKYLQSSDEEDFEDFSTDLTTSKSLWFLPVQFELDGSEEDAKSESRPNSSSANKLCSGGGGGRPSPLKNRRSK